MISLNFSPSMFRPLQKRNIINLVTYTLVLKGVEEAACHFSITSWCTGLGVHTQVPRGALRKIYKYRSILRQIHIPLYRHESESFRKAKKPLLLLGGCQCHLMLMRQKERVKSIYERKESRQLLWYLAGFCNMLVMLIPNEPFRGWASIPATPPSAPSPQGPTGN